MTWDRVGRHIGKVGPLTINAILQFGLPLQNEKTDQVKDSIETQGNLIYLSLQRCLFM